MDAKRARVAVGHDADSASADARMSIDVVLPAAGRGKLAIVAHGRNGSSDSPHAMKIVGAYLACGYLVLAPDLCNSNGNDSAGTGAEFTIGTHVRDVRRTIEWALREAGVLGWSGDGFALAGHSMGGYAVCRLAAEEYGARCAHILAVSPFTTGRRQFEARAKLTDGIATLQREAPLALEDWAAHDIFRFVDRLTMPVSTVAGRYDVITSPADVRELFDRLPRGQFCLLPDAHHCLEGDGVESILARQIRRLEAAAASPA